MLYPNLKVNGKKISSKKELEQVMTAERVGFEFGDDYALELEHGEDGSAFFGWFGEEEEVFYFDNGSGNWEPVDLCINICPAEWMMCYDPQTIWDIVFYFCETGKRHPDYHWVKDEMI